MSSTERRSSTQTMVTFKWQIWDKDEKWDYQYLYQAINSLTVKSDDVPVLTLGL